MNKEEIIKLLMDKHQQFIEYIIALNASDYNLNKNNKWNAAQQLEHIVLCVKPLVQVYSMERDTIKKMFGSTNRASESYDALIEKYKEKLLQGGKAPEKFVPIKNSEASKESLIESLKNMLEILCISIDSFSEKELDELCIPHPLLGNLTLREMLYNAISHVEHHHQSTIRNLTSNFS